MRRYLVSGLLSIVSMLCLMAASLPAYAIGLDFDLGATRAGKSDDGIWYQSAPETPYKLRLTSPSASIGIWGDLSDSIRWRAGYHYAGKFESDALAVNDPNYSTETRSCVGDCWYRSRYIGKGTVQGLYAVLQPGFTRQGVRMFAEVGAYAYRPTWAVHVPDWVWCADTSICPPQDIRAAHKPKWQVVPRVGLGVEAGRFGLVLTRQVIEARGDNSEAVYHGPAWNLSARYRF